MWQRFTEMARKMIFYAQEEAMKFGEGYVSTEHILLALTREPDACAARILNTYGIRLDRIRAEIERQLPRGEARPSQDMTLTPRAKRVIDLAYDEARHLQNNYIGTEHLLLGLAREGQGLAGRVLAKVGFELERGRAEVMRIQDSDIRSKDPAGVSKVQLRAILPGVNWCAICTPDQGDSLGSYTLTIYPTKTLQTKRGQRRVIDKALKPLDQCKLQSHQKAIDLGLFLKKRGGLVHGFPSYSLAASVERELEIVYPTQP